MKRAFFILITLMCLGKVFAQNSLWNSTTFPLSKDTISLDDMSGATTATFGGSYNATTLLDFPSGFSFPIGFTTYTQFSISAYGYIKLGGVPYFVNPTLQDTIISGLYAFPSTYPTCKYKMTGTAPNRKLVIEWIGTLSQSGPAHFQIWLYERIGRIQFLYKTIKSYALGNGYAIYCKAKVMNFSSVASIKTKPNNQLPIANYSLIEVNNYDSIYDKTRFTFQPDTVKPIRPGNLNFANELPGCFNVVFTDSSINESMFRIEKLDTGTNYYFL